MAQSYPRKTLSVFGAGGTTDDFEEFGSTAIAATNYTKDIATIQALSAWTNGWRPALVTAKAPILQDMNAVQYVHSYMQGSVFEEGIPEWDSGTTYSFGSVVKLPYTGGNNFQIFISIADGNTNNALPTAPASNAQWQFVYGFISGVFTMGTSIAFGATSTEGIVGTVTNDSAATGNVGEFIDAGTSSFANLTGTGQFTTFEGINLTAGDWDISSTCVFHANGATFTSTQSALSLFPSATTDHVAGKNLIFGTAPTALADFTLTIPRWRVSLSSPAEVVLKALGVYTVSVGQCYGYLSARRVR